MKTTIISALSSHNGSIGKDGTLMWALRDDLMHFKHYTDGKVLVMGRKTFLSLPKWLTGRTTLVLSNHHSQIQEKMNRWKSTYPDEKPPLVIEFESIETIFDSLEDIASIHGDFDELVFIGGSQVYAEAANYVDEMILTLVNTKDTGDVFFPNLNLENWEQEPLAEIKADEKNEHDAIIVKLTRKNKSNVISFSEKKRLSLYETYRLQQELGH